MKSPSWIVLILVAFFAGVWFGLEDSETHISDGVVSVVNTTQDTIHVVVNGTTIPVLPDNVLEFEGAVTVEIK